MFDSDHVEILRRGPRAWNAWRQQHEPLCPKLAGIALRFGEQQMGPISGGPINLAYAGLSGASLRFATLSSANLEAADLAEADLAFARLDHANLSYANLRNALLDHADFAGTKLIRADLSGANLQMARNLTERQLYATIGSSTTILPPDLRRPLSWEKAETYADDLRLLDTAREDGSTQESFVRNRWMLLYAGGMISSALVYLISGISRGRRAHAPRVAN